MPAIWGGAIAAGGSLLSGAFGGSKDPGPSAALQNSRADVDEQRSRLLDAFYGTNYRKSYNNAQYGGDGWGNAVAGKAGAGAQIANFNYAPGGAGGAGGSAANGSGASGQWGGNTPYGNAPILQQIMQASQQGISADQGAMANYGGAITRLGESGYRTAQQYGTGQNAVIDADSAKSLKDANALTQARMLSSGLGGSTLTTDEMGSNAAGNIREKLRAKAAVAQQASGMKINQRNTQAQQQQGLSALYNTFADRANQLRNAPINAQLQVLNSGVVNPFSVQGGSGPVGSTNGALGSLGNTLGTVGGSMLGRNLYNNYGQQSNSYDGGYVDQLPPAPDGYGYAQE